MHETEKINGFVLFEMTVQELREELHMLFGPAKRLYVAIHGSRSERAHARLVLDVAAELQGMAGSPTIGTEDPMTPVKNRRVRSQDGQECHVIRRRSQTFSSDEEPVSELPKKIPRNDISASPDGTLFDDIRCRKCSRGMVKRTNQGSRRAFLGCQGFEQGLCNGTRSLT
mmetsp:Transcript_35985/g.81246  ORF Transcript_35985/g.81246 Transcript_35985/m.81246 type:complete len:170 (-) Transcript_35985:80-589(-)